MLANEVFNVANVKELIFNVVNDNDVIFADCAFSETALTVLMCARVTFAFVVVINVELIFPMVAPPILATVKLDVEEFNVTTVRAVMLPREEFSLVTFAVPMIAVLGTFTPTFAFVNVQVDPV